MKCPLCKGNTVGKVANNQYYCWECFIEFSHTKNSLKIYEVEDDGSLSPLEMLETNSLQNE